MEQYIAVNKTNLILGTKLILKSTNEVNTVIATDEKKLKFTLKNATGEEKQYSFSTIKKNYKVQVINKVNDPGEEVKEEKVNKPNKKKKITNEQYLEIAEKFLSGEVKLKKTLAIEYKVDSATISDIFSEKYCRKSCKEAVEKLKIKYGYTK